VTADRQRVAAQVNCDGLVDFATPSSIRTVVNGIKTPVDDNSPVLQVDGLRSPAVQQGTNTDCAVEFEFRQPVMLAGIWLHEQVDQFSYSFINSRPSNTTVFILPSPCTLCSKNFYSNLLVICVPCPRSYCSSCHVNLYFLLLLLLLHSLSLLEFVLVVLWIHI